MYKYFKKIGNTIISYTGNLKDFLTKLLNLLLHLIIVLPQNYPIVLPKSYFGTKTRVKLNGSYLKQDKITYTHGTLVNIYIVYKLNSNLNYNDLTLENCLLGAIKLTKNANIDKYKYSGYGIGLDGHGTFSFPSSEFGCNGIIFGVDISSSAHVDNKKKNILILGEGSTQDLDDTKLTTEKNYSINFTVSKKNLFKLVL